MKTKWIFEKERKRKSKKRKATMSLVLPPQLSPNQQLQNRERTDKKNS